MPFSFYTYDNIGNMSLLVEEHNKIFLFNGSRSDVQLSQTIELKEPLVEYLKFSDRNTMALLFFIHSIAFEKIVIRGDVFDIHATSKANNVDISLFSVQLLLHFGHTSFMFLVAWSKTWNARDAFAISGAGSTRGWC